MIDLLRTIVAHGGLTVVLIALASVVALTVVIERCWRLLPLRRRFDLARQACRDALLRAGPAEAIASLTAPEPMARVLRSGLLLHERGPEAVRGAALGAAQQEVAGIERGLGIIQIVSQIAPWLGLLGTVVGLMDVFSKSGTGPGGLTHATASTGISQALGCTVAGLAVAIAAYVAYQLLSGLSTRLLDELEGAAEELPSFLKNTK